MVHNQNHLLFYQPTKIMGLWWEKEKEWLEMNLKMNEWNEWEMF